MSRQRRADHDKQDHNDNSLLALSENENAQEIAHGST
jgi:hypothetical protein